MRSLNFTNDDDDRAVSPVIGVILMVAITVILAAVIASFVLGLGQGNDPAPSPTLDNEFSSGELSFDVTGGDDFTTSDATFSAEITVENGSDQDTAEFTDVALDDGSATADLDDVLGDGSDTRIEYNPSVGSDEVTAGDSMTFNLVNGGSDAEITSWTYEIVWNPADQDSQIIYSDSS